LHFFLSRRFFVSKYMMNSETLFSPAKINLFLAITGRRSDGYHEMISLGAPVAFGDEIDLERRTQEGVFLECDQPDLPPDEHNLVVRAIMRFQEKTGDRGGWRVCLRKRIPVGGGLGGGSSNAANILLAVNRMLGHPLSEDQLIELGAEIGSDCPLFLREGPCVMRGRGELTEMVEESVHRRLRGLKLILFWPCFSIATPWAFANLDSCPDAFSSAAKAEESLLEWLAGEHPAEELVSNDFELVLGKKLPTFSVLLNDLRKIYGTTCAISGSGSACFAFARDDSIVDDIEGRVRSTWGEQAGFERVTLL